MIEVIPYVNRSGRYPFDQWFEKLDAETQARVTIVLARVRSGNLAAAKAVGHGVSDLRLHFGPGYRIYFGLDGDTLVILLGGGTKRRRSADIGGSDPLG